MHCCCSYCSQRAIDSRLTGANHPLTSNFKRSMPSNRPTSAQPAAQLAVYRVDSCCRLGAEFHFCELNMTCRKLAWSLSLRGRLSVDFKYAVPYSGNDEEVPLWLSYPSVSETEKGSDNRESGIAPKRH